MTRTPDDATVESPIPLGHVTVLAREDCPWTFSSEKDGEAAAWPGVVVKP